MAISAAIIVVFIAPTHFLYRMTASAMSKERQSNFPECMAPLLELANAVSDT
jgi:hypothetical protein